MKTINQARNMESLRERIDNLDLGPIKLKLMDKDEGQGWTKSRADAVEVEYKRFLYLTAKYPEAVITPDKNTDKFWHAHILDTLKYAEDCDRLFGHFLHHFPYFGMRGDADAKNLAQAARATRELYRQEFGEDDAQAPAYCGATVQADSTVYCGASVTAESAYCGASAGSQGTAYCGAASAVDGAAYCGATAKQVDSAYCGATAKANEAAYCGATMATAYCGATNAPAYCGSSVAPAVQPKAAMLTLNVGVRPTVD